MDLLDLLELDEQELHDHPLARRSGAASASLWSTLAFAALFASVLIGRVIVHTSQEQARDTQPTAAAVGAQNNRTATKPSAPATGTDPASDAALAPSGNEALPSAGGAGGSAGLRTRSARPRAASSDWRDGPMEPATSSFDPKATTPAALGTLRINSRPWSQVFIDGRLIGNTPQMSVPVAAGRHTVRLDNPELGMSKTVIVHVTAGELVTRVESLE